MKSYKPHAFSNLASAALGFAMAFPLASSALSTDNKRPTAPAQANAIITDGGLDPAFNAGRFTNGRVVSAVLQSDGKLLIGGGFTKVHGVTRIGIARLNLDGTLDTSFDQGSPTHPSVRGITVQQDGKILVLAESLSNSSLYYTLVRLHGDGSRDATFDLQRVVSYNGVDDGTGSATTPGNVFSVALQPDGKVVIVGSFYYIITGPGTNVARAGIARFHGDGSFDASFNPGAGFGEGTPERVLLQSIGDNAGKFIVQGSFQEFHGRGVSGLIRLNSTGTLDQTFDVGTAPDAASVFGLTVQSNDQVVVFGDFRDFNGAPRSGIVRLTVGGAVDSAFTTAAFQDYGEDGIIAAVTQQANGKLIVGGYFHSLGGAPAHNVVRLESNGQRDPTFHSETAGPATQYIGAVMVRPSDNKVFVGGSFASFGGEPRNNIAWLNPDGIVDTTFAGSPGATDYFPVIYALATQPDGKILVGGAFTSFGGAPRTSLVRLNADSSIDASFGSGLVLDGSVRALSIQANGKILIAGSFKAVNGARRGRVARLHADGTLDDSFNPGGVGADNIIYALTQDSQGSIFIGGAFKTFNGTPQLSLTKLTPSGTIDPVFTFSGANDLVHAITPPDESGRIVIGGAFTALGTTPAGRIAQLNAATGQVEVAPSPGFNNRVRTLLRTPDGNYIVGGSFFRYFNLTRVRLVRMTSNLGLDFGFSATVAGTPGSLSMQGDKLYVGYISSLTNSASQLVRLTNTGALDSSFMAPTLAVSPATAYTIPIPAVHALNVEADGKLLVGGTFNNYNGTERICLARLTDSRLAFTAVSRKTHGTSGTHDIPLPVTGSRGVECRNGGANNSHQVVFTFAAPVSFTDASVTSGSGIVMGASGSGTATITVDLTNVANAQTITLRLAAVSNGESTADLSVPMGILAGDTTGNGSVTTSDIGQTKGQSGQPVSAVNFRSDVTANGGSINASDIGLVKARSGTQLP